MLPTRSRRLWLSRISAWASPRPDRIAPAHADGVVVGGEIGRSSGLGEGARIMLGALDRLGVSNTGLVTGSGLSRRTLPNHTALVLHVNAPQLPAALIGLGRRALRGRRLVGYWAWELPVVPRDWHAALCHVHEAWVPSRFTAAALEPLMPGRVRVVPHAVALSPPLPSPMDRQAFGLPESTLVVLTSFNLASSFVRKNPLAAIAAFRQAFGDRHDRLLLLKVGHVEHYAADLALIQAAIGDAGNIRLETRMLPDGDMHALTRACDIVLSLHRSEGFGLVPAQAMLLGRPVVATDWSATAEFIDQDCGMPVGYRLVPAVDPRGVFEAPGAVWADADIDQAAIALRTLADDADRRLALGHAARRAAVSRFDGAGLASALAAIGVAA
jgi:glycosyltransferase involved in cell wall biosynthesis